jgi:hypothetical protein
MRRCKLCKKKVVGRSDKIFCSVACKSKYHRRLRNATEKVTVQIDAILHRNRSILLEILGKRRLQVKVNRIILEKKKFHYKYHTHFHINSKGKTYFYLYDIAWMSFSTDTILIVKSDF